METTVSEKIEIQIALLGQKMDTVIETVGELKTSMSEKDKTYTGIQSACNTRFNDIEKKQAVQASKIGFFSAVIATVISVLTAIFGGKM